MEGAGTLPRVTFLQGRGLPCLFPESLCEEMTQPENAVYAAHTCLSWCCELSRLGSGVPGTITSPSQVCFLICKRGGLSTYLVEC